MWQTEPEFLYLIRDCSKAIAEGCTGERQLVVHEKSHRDACPRRFGRAPATAASIILTTVTDVVGFFSFLGIAALFAPMLSKSLT